ncbi:MAG: hypothetical protein K9N11_09670 [Lentisphaeria bacterium]|nr:hypothetical protein [Candidatus Neomarinimicrobiota bacterium]MCF7843100.1 hypothetical protein [Lentisphaeria bacterium]
MNKRLPLLILPVLLWCQSPAIYHRPPAELLENTPFTVEVIAEPDFELPRDIHVYYRVPGGQHYNEIRAEGKGHAYRAVIPVDAVAGDTLYYFIIGDYASSGLAGLPQRNPKQTPYTVPILKLKDLIRGADTLTIHEPEQVRGELTFLTAPKVIVHQKITPWRNISVRYTPSTSTPAYHVELPDGAVECGMIRAVGNVYTGYVALYAAIRHMAAQQRADGFTELRYLTYTHGVGESGAASLPVMEAVYFSFGPTHQY